MRRDLSIVRNTRFAHAAILMFVFVLAHSVAAQTGATYYVAKTGNDSNPGTINSPWLTIQHAANSVSAGATVYVFGGVYNESVNLPESGTALAPITFESSLGETAVIDGTGLTCCTSNPPSSGNQTQGLVNIVNQSYVILKGFEIRNFTTSEATDTPTGIWITGSGTGIQILNNRVHDITTTNEENGNAFGISVYGTSKIPITQLVISGNEVYDLRTGSSESVNVDGNVTYLRSPTTWCTTTTISESTPLDTREWVPSATTRRCMEKSAETRSITSAESPIPVKATDTTPTGSTAMVAHTSRSSGTSSYRPTTASRRPAKIRFARRTSRGGLTNNTGTAAERQIAVLRPIRHRAQQHLL